MQQIIARGGTVQLAKAVRITAGTVEILQAASMNLFCDFGVSRRCLGRWQLQKAGDDELLQVGVAERELSSQEAAWGRLPSV